MNHKNIYYKKSILQSGKCMIERSLQTVYMYAIDMQNGIHGIYSLFSKSSQSLLTNYKDDQTTLHFLVLFLQKKDFNFPKNNKNKPVSQVNSTMVDCYSML